MEHTVTLRSTKRIMHLLFNEGAFACPEIPYFGLGIKSYACPESDKDLNGLDFNRTISFKVVVRSNKTKVRKTYDAMTFIKEFTTVQPHNIYNIPKSMREKFGYENDRFINGSELSDQELQKHFNSYKIKLDDFKNQSPAERLSVPDRIWNEAIDTALHTDLTNADQQRIFAEGLYHGTLKTGNVILEIFEKLNRLKNLRNKINNIIKEKDCSEETLKKLAKYWNEDKKTINRLKDIRAEYNV